MVWKALSSAATIGAMVLLIMASSKMFSQLLAFTGATQELTVFVTDLRGFNYVNESFKAFFSGIDFPARSTVEVSGLPLNAKVEIECIAFV